MGSHCGEEPRLIECELVVAHYNGLLVYRIAHNLVFVGKILKKSKNLELGELVGVSLPLEFQMDGFELKLRLCSVIRLVRS